MHRGYIKIFRKIKEWEWFKDSQTVHLFLYLLLTANHKPSRYMGQEIKRGELICGRKQLSNDTGITEQSLRTCLDRLKSTSEITSKSTNKFSIITLCKYEDYQEQQIEINQQNVSQLTSDQPATNQQLTTSKELKNEKNEKNNTLFQTFWSAYPRKEGKGSAIKAWNKITSPVETLQLILDALKWQTESNQWKKDNGQYIPMPTTYLNQQRWTDENKKELKTTGWKPQ